MLTNVFQQCCLFKLTLLDLFLAQNQCCGENFVRASNSYVTLCILVNY